MTPLLRKVWIALGILAISLAVSFINRQKSDLQNSRHSQSHNKELSSSQSDLSVSMRNRPRPLAMLSLAGESSLDHGASSLDQPPNELDDDELLQHYNKSRISALNWASSLPPGLARDEAFQVICRLWVEDDAEELGRALATNTSDTWIDDILPHYVNFLADKNPKLVIDGFAISNISLAKRVAEELAGWYARNSPGEGIKWMLSMESMSLAASARRRFAREWAESAPKQAIEWAINLEQHLERVGVRRSAFEGWATTDPIAASEWLSASDLGRTDTEMVNIVVQELIGIDYSLALRWTASLNNDEARDTIIRSWMMRDDEAVWNWINAQSFSEKQLSAFREMAPTRLGVQKEKP